MLAAKMQSGVVPTGSDARGLPSSNTFDPVNEMRTSASRELREALSHGQGFMQLVLSAAVLGLGINLMASSLFAQITPRWHAPLLLGILLVAASISYFAAIALRSRHINRTIEALLLFDSRKKEIVAVPGYTISINLQKTLEAAFLENTAFADLWKSDPLAGQVAPDTIPELIQANGSSASKGRSKSARRREQNSGSKTPPVKYAMLWRVDVPHSPAAKSKSAAFFREAVEYLVIEQLSRHLSNYLGNLDEDENIKCYERGDVPHILLENRILNTLSTPLEDRPLLKNALKDEDHPINGELHSVFGSDGSVYQRFDLVLPRDTIVSRPRANTLRLENNRLVVEFGIVFEGFHSSLPEGFAEFYLGSSRKSWFAYSFNIEVTAHVKPLALLRQSGWRNYDWIDSFAEQLDCWASFGAFLERIGWRYILPSQRVLQNIAKLSTANPKAATRRRSHQKAAAGQTPRSANPERHEDGEQPS